APARASGVTPRGFPAPARRGADRGCAWEEDARRAERARSSGHDGVKSDSDGRLTGPDAAASRQVRDRILVGGWLHEVLIIGGGPAGLTAGMYCRMRKMSVIVVD